jgi:predicted transcriptional regulator
MIQEKPFDREEERYRRTLKALADIDAGRTVDHEAVRAWAESLKAGRRRRKR